jgi:hypothetical protein
LILGGFGGVPAVHDVAVAADWVRALPVKN